MFKLLQSIASVVVALMVVSPAMAGITIIPSYHTNSAGDLVATFTAKSDAAPITSMEVEVISNDGAIGQVHPFGLLTYLQDYNLFFGEAPVDHDTQVMFASDADHLLVITKKQDDEFGLYTMITGFDGFWSRDVLQVVVTDPSAHCDCSIDVMSGGQAYFNTLPCVPEPASFCLFTAAALVILRRR